MKDWSTRLHHCVIYQVRHPVHVLRYEDLQKDPIIELGTVLNFLNVSYSTEVLRTKVEDGYSEFHRRHKDNFEHFTSEQEKMIRTVSEKAKDSAERANIGGHLGLDEYLARLF